MGVRYNILGRKKNIKLPENEHLNSVLIEFKRFFKLKSVFHYGYL